MKSAIAAIVMLSIAWPAFAQDFTPGRPGATESPIALPQGRWQIETEVASYERRDKGESLSALQTTFRYGVARGWDAEAVISPYNRVATPGEHNSGVGDASLRVRKTIADLDGRGASLGVIGFISLPTGSDGIGADGVEGGLSPPAVSASLRTGP